jgi:hypothetical protein
MPLKYLCCTGNSNNPIKQDKSHNGDTEFSYSMISIAIDDFQSYSCSHPGVLAGRINRHLSAVADLALYIRDGRLEAVSAAEPFISHIHVNQLNLKLLPLHQGKS